MILKGHRPNPPAPTTAEAPADPRPAWERVAYTWLAREVDGGHQVDPAALAAEVSVTPRFTAELLQVLRAQRQRDPALVELRGRLVRAELAQWVRRGEELATLGARVVFDLQAESRAAKPAARVWAVKRRAERASRPAQRQAERSGRPEQARTERAERPDRPHYPGGDRDER